MDVAAVVFRPLSVQGALKEWTWDVPGNAAMLKAVLPMHQLTTARLPQKPFDCAVELFSIRNILKFFLTVDWTHQRVVCCVQHQGACNCATCKYLLARRQHLGNLAAVSSNRSASLTDRSCAVVNTENFQQQALQQAHLVPHQHLVFQDVSLGCVEARIATKWARLCKR
jgi:hypothetical protein